jgi:bacillithiol biosynthesis cysteine-adding enzyme BshC
VIEVPTAQTLPIAVVPGLQNLFLDFCAGSEKVRAFYRTVKWGTSWQQRPALPAHWPELVALVAEQNTGPETAEALEALRQGAGTVLTGQQVGLFGGPLYTPLKAATVLARARQATAAGHPHVGIFWPATDDHDFAEIDHVVIPAGRELVKLKYKPAKPLAAARPVGGIEIDAGIEPLLDQAYGLLGDSFAMDALNENYKPGRTFAEAFCGFYAQAFAAEGLLMVDAAGRAFRRMGVPVLRAAMERADELHAALEERNRELQAAGYHSQVAVGMHSSLLFLIDAKSQARVALKRIAPSSAEPQGLWQMGRQFLSTDELLGILENEPERISPSALLRPVFQDYLFSTSQIVGGPAELAYFAQNAVLYERILGRQTQPAARFSATLVEPSIADLLNRHELKPEQLFTTTEDALAQQLAERAMPCEGRMKIKTAGQALEAELDALVGWLEARDEGLGRSARTSASKMRYQMNRMRRMAAGYELHREAALGRAAKMLTTALYPQGMLQERLHGAAYYFAKYGFELTGALCRQAELEEEPEHALMWL